MNKIVKRKIIGIIICFAISILGWTYLAINGQNISEELISYLNGFLGGISGVALYFLVCIIRAIRNPKIAQNLEIVNQDERLHSINNCAMAITFRICMILEAITSVILAILGYMQVAEVLGFVICVQLILYIVIYYIVAYKN